MADLPAFLARCREAVAQATPGPWLVGHAGPPTGFCVFAKVESGIHVADVMEANSRLSRHEARANAGTIVLAVNSLPSFVEVAEAAANMRKALGWLEDEGQGYRIRDHACERCVPDGGALVQGFLCGRHAFDAALQKLAVQP